MSKICVNQDACIGCGACVAICPQNFDFNENGLSTVINNEVTEDTEAAKDSCPVGAITIEKEQENN